MSSDDSLWAVDEIAEYLGIRRTSVRGWIRRHQVPVAGYSAPHQGRVASLYRPEDVRAAAEAAPGSGNRTPRRNQ